MIISWLLLLRCRHELRNLKLVWETVDTIHGQQEEWKQQSWQKMNTKFLREVSNGQLEQVKGLPEEAHYWDVYLGLEDSILIIQVRSIDSMGSQTWKFIFERARPFSFLKRHFHWKTLKSVELYEGALRSKPGQGGNYTGTNVRSIDCKGFDTLNFIFTGQGHFHFQKGTSVVKS